MENKKEFFSSVVRTEPNSKIVQMKNLGDILPIGILTGGNLDRDLAGKDWRLKEEKELGLALEKVEASRMGQYVSTVISVLCTQIGKHDFLKMKDPERRISVNTMWIPDVLYTYLWLRIRTMGNMLQMETQCTFCGNKSSFGADLNTVDISSVETMEDTYWRYNLESPILIRGNTITGFIMGPARWSAIDSLGNRVRNMGAMKEALIKGSIHWFIGSDDFFPIGPNELDELKKRDIEDITRQLDKNALGPDMSIEEECVACGKVFRTSLDWRNQSFFGISS